MIGKTLSHFKIADKLGEDGMGEVYRAMGAKLDREGAIMATTTLLPALPTLCRTPCPCCH